MVEVTLVASEEATPGSVFKVQYRFYGVVRAQYFIVAEVCGEAYGGG
jgi:hypothetical protein